jgi:hypothetical protein
MGDERSLEGWDPSDEDGVTLVELVDHAFVYRGDVSLETVDGRTIVGYLFNRDTAVSTPFAEVMETETGARLRFPYAQIRTIRFTGRDTAAGQSWDAWQRRREANSKATRARE